MEDGVKLALASAGILAGLTLALGAEARWGSMVSSADFNMEMDKSLIIHTPTGELVSLTAPGGKAIGTYPSFTAALDAATVWIKKSGRVDILHVDEKGNVDLIDHHGNIIVSWA